MWRHWKYNVISFHSLNLITAFTKISDVFALSPLCQWEFGITLATCLRSGNGSCQGVWLGQSRTDRPGLIAERSSLLVHHGVMWRSTGICHLSSSTMISNVSYRRHAVTMLWIPSNIPSSSLCLRSQVFNVWYPIMCPKQKLKAVVGICRGKGRAKQFLTFERKV